MEEIEIIEKAKKFKGKNVYFKQDYEREERLVGTFIRDSMSFYDYPPYIAEAILIWFVEHKYEYDYPNIAPEYIKMPQGDKTYISKYDKIMREYIEDFVVFQFLMDQHTKKIDIGYWGKDNELHKIPKSIIKNKEIWERFFNE